MKKSTGETYPELDNDDDDKMTRELLSIKMKTTFYVCIGTKKTRMRERERALVVWRLAKTATNIKYKRERMRERTRQKRKTEN